MKKILPLSCVMACVFLLLGCIGVIVPLDFLFNLAAGWGFYLYRVLPQVRVSGMGVATALVCMAAFAVGLQWLLHWPARRTSVVLGLIVLMFVAGIAVVGIGHQTAWLLTSPEPIVESGRVAITGLQSRNNLKQMALAMHNYQDTVEEKSLPPAALCDRQGHPLLSWRVLILPYVENQSLYNRFHLDEPWDSPHNLRLLAQMPKVYKSPYPQDTDKPYHTHYRVFVGKGAAFEGSRRLRIPEDFPDGTSNTLLIIEATEAVPWTKPAELSFDRNRPSSMRSWRNPLTFQAAMADGSVRSIDRSVTESTLRAAITRNGGDKLGEDW